MKEVVVVVVGCREYGRRGRKREREGEKKTTVRKEESEKIDKRRKT